MKRLLSLLAVLSISLTSLPGLAASKAFKLDETHAFAVFHVRHLGYSTMIGSFNRMSGSLELDQQTLANSRVSITIDTNSVFTNHQERDEHLRSADFFDTAKFPEMSFESTRVVDKGDGVLDVEGRLTLLGVTRPVTLQATLNKVAPHPLPKYNKVLVAGFSARTTIKRSEFGMDYALGGVGDEVDIRLEVEFHQQ